MNTSSDEVEALDSPKLARGTRIQKSTTAREHRKKVKEVLTLKTEKEDRLIEARIKNELL
jgi:hypothetical protein